MPLEWQSQTTFVSDLRLRVINDALRAMPLVFGLIDIGLVRPKYS